MKQSIKKAAATIIAFAILIGGIALAIYLKQVANYKRSVSETSIEEICLSNIPNGIYIGECDVNFIYAKVEVTIQNGEITGIRILEHKNERGQAAEAVVDRIVAEQRIDVDAVSGATNSSTGVFEIGVPGVAAVTQQTAEGERSAYNTNRPRRPGVCSA